MSTAAEPSPSPGRRARRVGTFLLWPGLVLLVAFLVVTAVAAYDGFSRHVDSPALRQTVDGPVRLTLEAGERRMFLVPAEQTHVVVPGGDDLTVHRPLARANCTVEGPAVQDDPVEPTQHESLGDEPYASDRGFLAQDAGTYTVTCDPDPADAEVVVAPYIGSTDVPHGLVGIAVGGTGAFLGFAIALTGFLLRLAGRNTLKKHGAR